MTTDRFKASFLKRKHFLNIIPHEKEIGGLLSFITQKNLFLKDIMPFGGYYASSVMR